MTTALDIITDAQMFAGIGDQYNAIDANTSSMEFRFLNNMLDSVSEEEYSIFDVVEGTFPLANGVQAYILGTDVFSVYPTARPQMISSMNIVDSSSVTHPITLIGTEQWANDIIYKPAPGRPEYCYIDYNALSITANFWPLPSFSNDICHFWYNAVLAQFASLTGTLTAPPGYTLWMVYELGAILAEMNNMPLSTGKKEMWQKARKNMRALNRDINILDMDVPTSDRTTFNIYTGDNNP